MTDRETLTALLGMASRQSEPFQSLIRDYAADVIADPGTHRLFSERIAADFPMQREIDVLKASMHADRDSVVLGDAGRSGGCGQSAGQQPHEPA